MEISKGLQEEIILVQNKLNNAIREHQICVGKLKDEPSDSAILNKIQEIQVHIVSLGRCQKKIVERLRKEVEVYKADNANGAKVSLATLLGLNNNNHITTYSDKRDGVKVQSNGIDGRRLSRDDYEDFGRNHNGSSRRNLCAKDRSSSVETLSADEDIMEVSNDENSTGKQSEASEIDTPVAEEYQSDVKQVNFLGNFGLITRSQLNELQNKKGERKRRSTANPQFVYSSWDLPSKRRRHAYLQSIGTAPQTRQTTARLNGPSPPPTELPKSTSPPTKALSKSLITSQKSAVRPNILRTMQETKALHANKFPKARAKLDNGTTQKESVETKPTETKSVHIPGLPASLTIERIESDTAVCIHCRNPGTLTICDACSANYHISCHTISPPPPRECPKCFQKKKEDEPSSPVVKKDEELAAASYAPGVAGKAGEDPEIDKAPHGLHKSDAIAHRQVPSTTTSSSITQLPSSTLLIPLAPAPLPTPRPPIPPLAVASLTYTPLAINTFSNQHQGITYIKSDATRQSCEQQYLILKKLPVTEAQSSLPKSTSKSTGESSGDTNTPSGSTHTSQLAQSSPLLFDKLSRGTKKPIPGLNPINPINTSSDLESFVSQKAPSRDKSDTNYPFTPTNSPAESATASQPLSNIRLNPESDPAIAVFTVQSGNGRAESAGPTQSPEPGDVQHSVLPGHQQSNSIANRVDKPSRHDVRGSDSVADRLARRLSEDRAAHHRSRQPTSKFTEHVKLEEAHLSAPFAANLGEGYDNAGRPRSCPSVELENRGKPRILVRKERRSLDSLRSLSIYRREDFRSNREEKENVGNEVELFDESTMSASEDEKTAFKDDDELDRVSIVSSIDMQVLEDFEIAMRHIDSGKSQTAN